MNSERGVLDTSVFVASETGRRLNTDLLPGHLATSVVTLAELQVGVLAAADTATRAQRLETLDSIADMEILPIDEEVARVWARMRVHLAETGNRVRINDLWIAAIAARNDAPVVTQDADFRPLDGVAGLRVVTV